MSETTEKDAWGLDIDDVFELPDDHPHSDAGKAVIVLGVKQPDTYGSAVIAYGDPETGDFEGLFATNPENEGGPTVDVYEHWL